MLNRRDFLKIGAGSSLTASLAACNENRIEKIIPLLTPQDHIIPGEAVYYATTCRECTGGCGILVSVIDGRAIKIEGNPSNPINKGKVCAKGQAALQGLYNPSRIKQPLLEKDGEFHLLDWKTALDHFSSLLKNRIKNPTNRKILFISQPESGSIKTLIQNWLQAFGGGDSIYIDLIQTESIRKANELAFGTHSIPEYQFDKVELLVSFGADFLESWLNPVQFAAGFAAMHTFQNGAKGRFIHISPHLSLTGSNADEWIPCQPSQELMLGAVLLNHLIAKQKEISSEKAGLIKQSIKSIVSTAKSILTDGLLLRIETLAKEMLIQKSMCLAGGFSSGNTPSSLQIVVNWINCCVGAINESIHFGANYQFGGDPLDKIRQHLKDIQNGKYDLVITNNSNPVYVLPFIDLKNLLGKSVPHVSLSTEQSETTETANLVLPTNHYLESWGDVFVRNGQHTLQQPVMLSVPGFQAKETGDILLQTAQLFNPSAFSFLNFHEYLQVQWKKLQADQTDNRSFDVFWKRSLQQGGAYQDFKKVKVNLQPPPENLNIKIATPDSRNLTLLAFSTGFQEPDGKTGNRHWLLETPNALSQVTWDVWAELHPNTAKGKGIEDGDKVRISTNIGSIEATARVHYGIAQNCIAVPLGFGKDVVVPAYKSRKSGSFLIPVIERDSDLKMETIQVGMNVLKVLPEEFDEMSGDLFFQTEITSILKADNTSAGAIVDGTNPFHSRNLKIDSPLADNQKGRGLIQTVQLHQTTVSNNRINLQYPKNRQTEDRNIYERKSGKLKKPEDPLYSGQKWEMVIDLDRCTGCSACVIACYAENNIAVVGKERMKQGREMSWLRVERYFEFNSDSNQFETYFSPQMCSQCDNAGCEPVCPVMATYQTKDGLNAMIYNRCVGSRYCANNCAFSQRRFNWRDYRFISPLHYQLNPFVTVRSKGVMEKCTFCQHRIRRKQIKAKQEGRSIKPGEVKTACQQTCPTNAIYFGNAKDKNDKLQALKADARHYTQFESLNYQPAQTYLKKVLHNNRKA